MQRQTIHIASLFSVVIMSIGIVACESKLSHGNSTINEFSLSILDAAKRGDINTLVDNLTSYSDSDLEWIRSQTGKAVTSDTIESDRKKESLKDVKLWLNSYSDLFDLEPSSWSVKKMPSFDKAEVFSLIVWVEKDKVFEGILIGYSTKIKKEYKVIQWVNVSGREAYYGVTKKRARLMAKNIDERKYPRNGISYGVEMNAPDAGSSRMPGFSPMQ